MIKVHIDATISRPIEVVFEQLIDISRYPEWMPDNGLFVSCTKVSQSAILNIYY